MSKNRSSKNKSFQVVNEGAKTQRPMPPGKTKEIYIDDRQENTATTTENTKVGGKRDG